MSGTLVISMMVPSLIFKVSVVMAVKGKAEKCKKYLRSYDQKLLEPNGSPWTWKKWTIPSWTFGLIWPEHWASANLWHPDTNLATQRIYMIIYVYVYILYKAQLRLQIITTWWSTMNSWPRTAESLGQLSHGQNQGGFPALQRAHKLQPAERTLPSAWTAILTY